MHRFARRGLLALALLFAIWILPSLFYFPGLATQVGDNPVTTSPGELGLQYEEVIVPNSLLVQNQVKNLRLSDSLLRVRVPVGVAYRTDLRAAFGALERAAAQMPSVSERTPVVNLLGFGDSAVQLEVSIWVQEPWEGAQARSQLALRVWDALHEAGIEIAFPQLDVHLDPEGVGALAPASSPPAGR